MNDRHFHLRMQASYESEKNDIDTLNIDVLHEGSWEPLELNIQSPGFLMYINALFSCQHMYMRTNCAERGLTLFSSEGEIRLVASEIWEIRDISVRFNGRLKSGSLTDDALNYITERMHHCPVSTNLPAHVPLKISVNLE